ncbi:3'-5' exoribonuclease.1 [Mycolicibacterium vanbaalenii]|uniref:3'-5' exoribonuclease.1 n=2 Tax=Mycolicibacterium vanbaalenii TaxID=110539 RepID=A0A5S9R5Q5_MYCVN|nr:3'-5' exoribonuclease [Mycolicibacterium vanbaalenii]CAA0129290.1 3'-5' exoribonuclease.1 [Mycolicibacterium vanbaalenii]
MTNVCYDTEFLDDGHTIELISIGIVTDQARGEGYYAVNAECDFERIRDHDWLWVNVVPHLPTTKTDWTDPNHGRLVTRLDRRAACVKPKWVIANEVRDLILRRTVKPDLWAYFAAYDHVALAQLWGPMSDLPDGIPMYTHDLKQEMDRLGVRSDVVPKPENVHDALADARWNMAMLRHLKALS